MPLYSLVPSFRPLLAPVPRLKLRTDTHTHTHTHTHTQDNYRNPPLFIPIELAAAFILFITYAPSKPAASPAMIDPGRIRCTKESIISTDRQLILDDACKHQSVTLASEINWLRVWEAARDKGPYWTNVAQSFYRILTRPLFGDRVCNKCDSVIQEDTSYFSHLTQTHVPSTVDISRLLTDLRSHDSDPVTISFHCMKLLVSLTHTTSHPAS